MKKAFTLIELLIVLSITAILLGAGSSIYSNLQVSTQLNGASAQIVQDLRLAREQSLSGLNGTEHGLKFLSNSYVLFQGNSYSSRNTSYDRSNKFSEALKITTTLPNNEIVFSTILGEPNASGTITLAHEVSGKRIININSSGLVSE